MTTNSNPYFINKEMKFYCKKIYSNSSAYIIFKRNVTMNNFIQEVSQHARSIFNIGNEYKIEIVEQNDFTHDNEFGDALKGSYEETMEKRYGNLYDNGIIQSLYIRPVHKITGKVLINEDF